MAIRRISSFVTFVVIFASSTSNVQPQGATANTAKFNETISRIVVIGAHWCAPCRAELPELGALAAAARPARIALGWIDRKPVVAASLAESIAILSVSTAQDLANRHGAAARGVPFALAYAADGKLCTVWRGAVTPANLLILEHQCSQG